MCAALLPSTLLPVVTAGMVPLSTGAAATASAASAAFAASWQPTLRIGTSTYTATTQRATRRPAQRRCSGAPRMQEGGQRVRTAAPRVDIAAPPLDIVEPAPSTSPLVPHEGSTAEDAYDDGFALAGLATLTYAGAQATSSLARAGAYAVLDAAQRVRYVGYTSNVRASLDLHAAHKDACYVRVWAPHGVERDTLEGVLEYWVRELGGWPDGNTTQRQRWERESALEHDGGLDNKKKLYAAVFFAFLAHSIVKQVSYFGGGF